VINEIFTNLTSCVHKAIEGPAKASFVLRMEAGRQPATVDGFTLVEAIQEKIR
jgi:hypothetical protein